MLPQAGSASASRVSSPAGRMCHAYRHLERAPSSAHAPPAWGMMHMHPLYMQGVPVMYECM